MTRKQMDTAIRRVLKPIEGGVMMIDRAIFLAGMLAAAKVDHPERRRNAKRSSNPFWDDGHDLHQASIRAAVQSLRKEIRDAR